MREMSRVPARGHSDGCHQRQALHRRSRRVGTENRAGEMLQVGLERVESVSLVAAHQCACMRHPRTVQLVVKEAANTLCRCFQCRRPHCGLAQSETALQHVAQIELAEIVGHSAPRGFLNRAGTVAESILSTALSTVRSTFGQSLIRAAMHSRFLFIIGLIPAGILAQQPAPSATLRPITFLDRQLQRAVGSPTPSPDGKWLLYVLSTPDWSQAKSQSDIYLVSVKDGLTSTRQMTFTKDKNETSPRWSRDGKFFAFLSNRDVPSAPSAGSTGAASSSGPSSQNQIHTMQPDGGEAQKITNPTD